MKELILIRHGEAEHHTNGRTGGWTDSPLTEKGRVQAERTAEYLKLLVETARAQVFSSDLMRARQTAQCISERLNLPVDYDGNLRELNNGIAKGKTQEEARLLENPLQEPALDWVPYPEAESWRMMHQRVSGCMESIQQRAPEIVVIISHANAIICIINWWLKIFEDHHLQAIMYETHPCAVTHLKKDSLGCRVIYKLNDTSHLEMGGSKINHQSFGWPTITPRTE